MLFTSALCVCTGRFFTARRVDVVGPSRGPAGQPGSRYHGHLCIGSAPRGGVNRRPHTLCDGRVTASSSDLPGGFSHLFTPPVAHYFLGSVAALLALTGTFGRALFALRFSVWIFFALTAIASLFAKNRADLLRPYRAWVIPGPRVIFLLAAVALTINLWMIRPVRSHSASQ